MGAASKPKKAIRVVDKESAAMAISWNVEIEINSPSAWLLTNASSRGEEQPDRRGKERTQGNVARKGGFDYRMTIDAGG